MYLDSHGMGIALYNRRSLSIRQLDKVEVELVVYNINCNAICSKVANVIRS